MFLTLYLQLLGMSDAAASALMALFLGGSALGGLVGGWLGDKAAQVTPPIQFSTQMHGSHSTVPAPSIPHAAVEVRDMLDY